MSLADRDYMRAARPGRVIRLDGRPVDGIVLDAEPARSSRIHAPRRRRPPLRLVLIGAAALGALAAAGWLAPDAVAVIEADRSQPEIVPEGFVTLDSRDYGRTRIVLARQTA